MKRGFTLVELLVSISIISILSTIGVQIFYEIQNRSRLEEDVSKVTLAVREVQNMSLAPSRSKLGASQYDKICSVGIQLKASDKNIKYFYTTQSTANTCSTTINVYDTLDLSYVSIGSDTTFEFNIPFADVLRTGSVVLSFNNITKTIELDESGLIKTN